MTEDEILVPLDESDLLAHCERQDQRIRELEAALEAAAKEKDEHHQATLFRMKSVYDKDCKDLKEQIIALRKTIEEQADWGRSREEYISEIAALKKEITRLSFGQEPLLVPRADKP